MDKPHYLGHRKRLKEKYIKAGFEGWPDYEILEILLYYAIPQVDIKPRVKKLLARFNNLSGVLDAGLDELTNAGLTENTALLLKISKDISGVYSKQNASARDIVSSPQLAIAYLKAVLKGSRDEEFYVLFLDSSNQLVSAKKLHDGVVNKSVIYPRKVVEFALQNKASGVIIAHNHPSGSLKPSEEDIKSTASVKDALGTVEVGLLDHIIISRNGYLSFKEEGML